MPFRKQKKPTGLMALAGETAKMAQSMLVLDKTEAALEKEMEKEKKREKPSTKIGMYRRKGAHLIHGKHLLLMVVILNIVDCLLVLGELMLDIKYVTDLLTKEYERSEEFIGSMKGLYPVRLGYLGPENIEVLEHEILTATLTWHSGGNSAHGDKHGTSPDHIVDHSTTSLSQTGIYNSTTSVSTTMSTTSASSKVRKRRASVDQDPAINSNHSGSGNDTDHGGHGKHVEHHHAHSIEEEIAHGLHKASISILGILVCETFFKIFCMGKELLEHKLECVDGFIVIASFIVDIVFIKGLQQFTVQEFVLILAFMVPWRIIRVVNSLVVAIMDHEHFRLVLLYKQKKKISQELKEAKDENKGLEACIDALRKMCVDAGLPEQFVTAKLNLYRKVKAKSNALGAISNFAMGGSAMDKPFQTGKMPSQNVTFTDETTSKQAKQLEDVLSEKPDVTLKTGNQLPGSSPFDKFGKNVNNTHPLIDQRRRSRSAEELRSAFRKEQETLNMLAENSASFIATMNKDGIDLGKRTDARTQSKDTDADDNAADKADGSESSESSTTDSFDSKNKTDKEELVNNSKDDDVQDFDNPTSRL